MLYKAYFGEIFGHIDFLPTEDKKLSALDARIVLEFACFTHTRAQIFLQLAEEWFEAFKVSAGRALRDFLCRSLLCTGYPWFLRW